MRVIRAVVFDLDGLLVDSEPLQAWAWDEYVQRFDTRLRPDVLNRMLGLRAVDAVEVAIEMLGLPVSGVDALRERDAIFLAAVPGAIHPTDGAVALIEYLRGRRVPLALATSGHRRYVDLALESAGLSDVFAVEVTGDMVQRGKPHPDVYLRASALLDIAPEHCLALEDAPHGITSARAAGMLCFAVPDRRGEEQDVSHADAVLSSLADVRGELDRRGIALVGR